MDDCGTHKCELLDNSSMAREIGRMRTRLFLVCTFLVKCDSCGDMALGIPRPRRYSDNEASRMPNRSSMEKVIHDPVLSAFEFPLRRTFYPYGFPLEIETNSTDVIAAASEGWGAFEQVFHQAPARLCLGVKEGSTDALPAVCVIRAREHMMSIVADPENFVICDLDRGFAFGWITENTAADHPLLRYRFLLAGGATLVQHRAFAPLHGALLARNGIGVMLTGDSFAGKSTLAYACARSGWTYVSDDSAFIVRERDDRYAIGDPHSIRFRSDAPQLFPELSDRLPAVRPNGKIAIEIRTIELGLQTAPGCQVEHVVYLNRERPGRASLQQVPKERMFEDWAQHICFGTPEICEAQRRSHERMLTARLWEMHYADLDDAVARLERLVDSGS
jgi:hypothetical protein